MGDFKDKVILVLVPARASMPTSRSGLIDSAEVRLPMTEVSPEFAARLDREIARRTAASAA